jgi:hypothetical protein
MCVVNLKDYCTHMKRAILISSVWLLQFTSLLLCLHASVG